VHNFYLFSPYYSKLNLKINGIVFSAESKKTMNKSSKKDNNSATAPSQGKLNVAGDQDIQDSPKDQEKLKPESATIELPDVKDIPGQEFIHPAPLGELADTTISSDDEEGTDILDEEEEDLSITKPDISLAEKKVLQMADEDMPTKDDENLRKADMDNTDNEGEPLNEEGFGDDVSGNDLDVPGAEADDLDEEAGSEDEENNVYSASDENNDNSTKDLNI
jgi:hypothetical protein